MTSDLFYNSSANLYTHTNYFRMTRWNLDWVNALILQFMKTVGVKPFDLREVLTIRLINYE